RTGSAARANQAHEQLAIQAGRSERRGPKKVRGFFFGIHARQGAREPPMGRDVIIFDTTLRDGEQAPGNSMTAEEKLRLARQLDTAGVDVIEAGFPSASEGDRRGGRVVEAAIAAGATTINLPDTVGYALPVEYGAMFRAVRERVPNADRVVFSAHCHDDLGLAVANSLAAIEAGAGQVECTVNGIGE